MGKVLMVQGTSSGAGKSLTVMALCRHFKRKGLKVAPFKSQNMSLNSAVSIEGGEMARSQYVQAIACEEAPSVKMNPILLKPEVNGSQVIILGRAYNHVGAKEYMESKKQELLSVAIDSLKSLVNSHDLVVIEGAGSPVEINLKMRDIVNMRIAQMMNAPVILITDIERGGAFAQIVGTMELFDKFEKKMVIGYMFNKFRGDKSLLGDYPEMVAKRYDMKFFGTMPYINHRLPEEDSLIDRNTRGKGDLTVNILKLPHFSNFDDFDPLLWNTKASFIESGVLNGDIVVIPGTKMTIEDLKWMKSNGLDKEIKKARERGAYIVGICGGYQILGRSLYDPTTRQKVEGLGLLPNSTTFKTEKVVANLEGHERFSKKNLKIAGYEIHHGISHCVDAHPFAQIESVNGKPVDYSDGFINERIFGTYFHGLFQNFDFTEEFLNIVRRSKGMKEKKAKRVSLIHEIDTFTDVFESNIDLKVIEEKL